MTQEELLASLKANELEIAGLKKKIALLEAEAAESTQVRWMSLPFVCPMHSMPRVCTA